VIGRPLQLVNEIINTNKQITPETAVQLSQAFPGTSPELWANLEALYRVRLAKKAQPKSDVERRSRLYALAPMAELISRGWINRSQHIDDLESAVCEFLGISSLEEGPTMPVVNWQHTNNRDPESRAQLAWIKRVEALVHLQHVARFTSQSFKTAAPEVFSLAASAPDVVRLPEALNDLGVRFIVVPHLPRTYLDGAAFRTTEGPVVAVTLRFDRLDHFWFALAHEAAHIARGDDGVLDAPPDRVDRSKDPRERASDLLASNWLIDPKGYAAFRQATADVPTRAQIEAFADRVGRHPSIIVGRLQHDAVITYGQHRWAHTPIRSYLADWTDRIQSAA
jgi:HTH-type transcriptional regulator/antitoxin HigA